MKTTNFLKESMARQNNQKVPLQNMKTYLQLSWNILEVYVVSNSGPHDLRYQAYREIKGYYPHGPTPPPEHYHEENHTFRLVQGKGGNPTFGGGIFLKLIILRCMNVQYSLLVRLPMMQSFCRFVSQCTCNAVKMFIEIQLVVQIMMRICGVKHGENSKPLPEPRNIFLPQQLLMDFSWGKLKTFSAVSGNA